jgi:hypothetical protein
MFGAGVKWFKANGTVHFCATGYEYRDTLILGLF